jgi:2-polyprenyl-6-methoxyphenol hydroxylase-like FAD-dependent oxidoreductase
MMTQSEKPRGEKNQVVIVGAGPTGAALALLLVKQGIAVTLVEAAKDFRRVFRGEGLMPSGLDALAQMGLAPLLDRVPHRQISGWEFLLGDRLLFRVDEPMGAKQPCTLVSQPPLLEALVAEARSYPMFEFIQGVAVKDLLWSHDSQTNTDRVIGVRLGDGREIAATLVIGADGRNSVIRQRAGLELVKQPKEIDVLWFKLPAHPRFVEDNVFCSIVNGNSIFSIFHGAEAGKLHLAWVLSVNDQTQSREHQNWQSRNWAEIFASLSPAWLAAHFRSCADAIEPPIRLSVVVGRCPVWHKPGVLLLGDAAHPMSPVRAQGINLALRDVIVAANDLVPLLRATFESGETAIDKVAIDAALFRIQSEREPEIIRAQALQWQEAKQGERIRESRLLRRFVIQFAPLLRHPLRSSWVRRQQKMREGVTSVKLVV